MATDSDSKLTRHISTVTVVTADFANSLFGGEHGYNTSEGEYHPLRHGHVHDGRHLDGHVSQVKLDPDSDGRRHVRGFLNHANLGGTGTSTPAVQVSNVQSYTEAEIAALDDNPCIPEYYENPDTLVKHFYLDLSMTIGGTDTHVQYNEDGRFGGDDGFVYDYSTGRVGIGTGDPDYALHIFRDDNTSNICIEDHWNDYGGPDLKFKKARADAVVSDNDYIGNIQFYAHDGTDTLTLAAGISGRVDGTVASNSVPGEIEFYTRAVGGTGTAVRLKIKNDGKIGMGEGDPQGFLTVSAANSEANPSILIHEDSSGGGRISFTNTIDAGSPGPTGDSHEWVLYGLPAEETDQANAEFNIWYGDHSGSGVGENILQVKGDGEVVVSGTITVDSATDEQDYGLHIKKNGGYSAFMVKLENEDATSTQNSWVIAQQDDGDFNLGDAYDDPKFVIQADTGYIGINEASPVRMLHVTDDGSGDPPVRIENLMEVSAAGDYDPVVWDSATGDLYFDSSINEDQDLFYTIKAANAGGGATDGGTFDAASTADTLIFDAGKGIEINAGTSDIVAVSLNAVLDDIADVNAPVPGTGHVLTYNGSAGEWQAAASGGPGVESLATQWVGAAEWVGASAGPHVTLAMGTSGGLGSRDVACRALQDNTGDTMELYTMIPIPLQQSVTDASGSMDGSHHANTTTYDSVSGFPLAGPTNCRVTLFYIFDMSSGQGGVSDINFEVKLYHNSHTPGGNMFEFADGQLVTDSTSGDIWHLAHHTGAARMNQHIYNYHTTGEPSGYYYAISDFSDRAIYLDETNCGMYQFKAVLGPVFDTAGPGYGVGKVYFIGGRFQWIW